jgi:hypothetical protein
MSLDVEDVSDRCGSQEGFVRNDGIEMAVPIWSYWYNCDEPKLTSESISPRLLVISMN